MVVEECAYAQLIFALLPRLGPHAIVQKQPQGCMVSSRHGPLYCCGGQIIEWHSIIPVFCVEVTSDVVQKEQDIQCSLFGGCMGR
eukprot:5853854-Amphidinium_carterae.1